MKMLSDLGHRVTAVDREVGPARVHGGDRVVLVEADLEAAPWPFPGRLFDAVVVTNYLWRPLLPTLIGSVAAGGLLIYETFMQGQEHYGRPSNPDYLLRPGELRAAVAGELDVVAFEQGPEGDPVTGFRPTGRSQSTHLAASLPPEMATAWPVRAGRDAGWPGRANDRSAALDRVEKPRHAVSLSRRQVADEMPETP